MSNANAISDLERAEHLGYADGAGVKRVSVYNNGTQINAATEETLQATLFQYKLAKLPVSGDSYTYLGYLNKDGGWYISKIDETAGTVTYIKGDSDLDTAWSSRASNSYQAFNVIF